MEVPAGILVVPSTDLVGYGKWGDLTYQELWNDQPGYCVWTMSKFQELVKGGDELATKYEAGDSKMKRLAQWIKEADDLRAAIEQDFECNSDMELVEVDRPDDKKTLGERIAKLQADNQSSKFYAVASPEEHAGVYTSWVECKPHVVGIKGVMYKSFASQEEALDYVQNPLPRNVKEETEESKAAKVAKEEAKAAKVAEAKAAREQAKEQAKAAKAAKEAEAKAGKEEAKAAKAADANAAKAAKEKAKAATAAEVLKKRDAAGTRKRSVEDAIGKGAADGEAVGISEAVASSAADVSKPKRSRKASMGRVVSKATTEPQIQTFEVQAHAGAAEKPAIKSKAVMMRRAAGRAHAKVQAKAKVDGKTMVDAKATAKSKAKATAKASVKTAVVSFSSIAETSAAEISSSTTLAKEKPSKVRHVKEPQARTVEKDTVVLATMETSGSPSISEEVLKQAQGVGMIAALRNLASRIEIQNLGLSSEKLMDALLKADGLVNKAKGALLSPALATSPITPPKDSSDARAPQVSGEKLQKGKQQKTQDHDELAKELKSLSATLALVSAPVVKEVVSMKVGAQPNLSDAQMHRIKENRERALARRAEVVGA